MNPTMKSHGKYRIEYVLLICSFLAGALTGLTMAQSPTPAKPDPIVGKWHWSDNGSVPALTEIRADGTTLLIDHNGPKWRWIRMSGTWKVVPSDAAERHYEISWIDGMWIDDLALSQDGTLLYGQNNKHEKINGNRITDDAAATPEPQ
jgi:hypothetical protein